MTALSHDRVSIQQANIHDFAELKSLLNKANDYSILKSGLRQWNDMDRVYAQFQAQVEDGECFVIRDHAGSITSAMTMSETSDYWAEAGNDGQALYLAKFMKDPYKAGPNEGVQLLDFAAHEALKRGKVFLRCDTGADLPRLIKYYGKLGFSKVGSFVYPTTGREGVLLEMRAADLLSVIGGA